jgi:hypothetical protein
MRGRSAIAAVTLLTAGVLLLPGPASAAAAKPCGDVILRPGYGWIVGGAGVSCRFMRHHFRSMLTGNGGPPGWSCHEQGHGRAGTTPFFVYYRRTEPSPA